MRHCQTQDIYIPTSTKGKGIGEHCYLRGAGFTICAAMTRPVFKRAFPPAFMAAADTALQEQKLKRNCTKQ